jgi:polysaccharide biosynthesis protein PslH
MRILVITDIMPFPLIGGTPLRLYNLLSRVGQEHEVWLASLVTNSEEVAGVPRLRAFCRGVAIAPLRQLRALEAPLDRTRYLCKGWPPDLRQYYSGELAQRIHALTARVNFDVVEIVNSYMAPYHEALPPRLRRRAILTFIDVVFQRTRRVTQLEPRRLRRLRLRVHSLMMRRWEPGYAMRFARCITMSAADQRLLHSVNPALATAVVPNGVAARGYTPLPPATGAPSLIFVGDMAARTNIDAARFFCREVLPQVRAEIPQVETWIVGANPSAEVLSLAGAGVHVTGRVAEVGDFYRRSSACIVPLRAGGGTRLKILEAMALGRPVITTTIGCEGIDGVDGQHLLLADSAAMFAAQTVRLLRDAQLRQQLATQARELVLSRYDWDLIARELIDVYAAVASQDEGQAT